MSEDVSGRAEEKIPQPRKPINDQGEGGTPVEGFHIGNEDRTKRGLAKWEEDVYGGRD